MFKLNLFSIKTKNSLTIKGLLSAAILFSSLIANSTTYAKGYMVEVLVFENNNPSVATESSQYKEPREGKSRSQTWALEPTMLLEEAESIERSSKYKLLHHLSWGVESLPYEKSANYSVIEQDIRGWIKVYAEQLLFANIDVDFSGYRMTEKRRLKLNEKHFFDHPKFGLLMQVSRLVEKKVDEQ